MTPIGNGKELSLSTRDFTGIIFGDVGPSGIDRCKEGFVEVISMGHSKASNSAIPGTLAFNAKHIEGTPRNCNIVHQALTDGSSEINITDEFKEPLNALKGMYTLLNVANGIGFGGEFVALANFFSPNVVGGKGYDGTSSDDLMFRNASIPDLSFVTPKESVVRLTNTVLAANFVDDVKQRTIINQWARGVDAVSAVLMRNKTINQWTTNDNLGAETAWIVTLPTFSFYTKKPNLVQNLQPKPPFAEVFSENTAVLGAAGLPAGGACNVVALSVYDRLENLLTSNFTHPGTPRLCYAVNPVNFNEGNLMGSTLSRNIDTNDAKNGWMSIDLAADAAANPAFPSGGLGGESTGSNSNNAGADRYAGLPAIAVAFTIRAKGEANTNFGALWQHSYERLINSKLNNTFAFAPVAKTGQKRCIVFFETFDGTGGGGFIDCAGSGQDGEYQSGVSISPRFTDNNNGTVTDNLTGLIWLKNASCFKNVKWTTALTNANTLATGSCGLTDNSVAGDWRLPNVKELQSLIHFGLGSPALLNTAGTAKWTEGDAFSGVESTKYWSSTTGGFGAWTVSFSSGSVVKDNSIFVNGTPAGIFQVWPVRSGQ
jgi:hypothetical protein